MDFSKDNAQSIITPELGKLLLEAISAAFGDYDKKVDAQARAVCTATTRAMFVNDHMVFHARDKMKKYAPYVRFVLRRGRTHLVIGPDDGSLVEVKMKKLNRNRRPSNIPTAEASDYQNQVPYQLGLPNMPSPIANLIAGYRLNSEKTGIEAVYIVYPEGAHNKWEWKLDFAAQPAPAAPERQLVDSSPEPKAVVPKKRPLRERIA